MDYRIDAQKIKATGAAAKPVPAYKQFPLAELPNPIRRYIAESARAIGCEVAFVALPLLAALASAVGNTRRITLKHTWNEPCILWTVIVGDSGSHKTPALASATAVLSKMQDEALANHGLNLEDYQRELLKYETDLANWKRKLPDSRGEIPDKPTEPNARRYIVSDITIEALADRLQLAPRGLLVERDEIAGWMKSFDQYKGGKSGDVAHWLSLYNAKALRVDRKTGTQKVTYVPIASVSIAGGIQPETLARALGNEHFENGLAARLLVAYPPKRPRKWTNATVSEATERELLAIFERLLALDFGLNTDYRPCPIDLPLTPEAHEAWVAFYDRHGSEQAELRGNEAALWSKLEGTAARLALIIHLVRVAAGDATIATPDAVDKVSMEAGITLADWFGDEGRRVYAILAEGPEDRQRRELVDYIRLHGGRITARELTRGPRLYRDDDDDSAGADLNDLVKRGFGRWEDCPPGPRGGRPTTYFVLNDTDDRDEHPPVPEEMGSSVAADIEGGNADFDEEAVWRA